MIMSNRRVDVLTERECVHQCAQILISCPCSDFLYSQSFLYFGKGVPCGAVDDQGKMLLPEFGPPLRIFPSEYAESEYQLWTLQLISMTLIERNSGVSSELEPLTPLASSPVSSRSASPSTAESPKLDEVDQTDKRIWTNKGIGPNEGSRYPGQGLRVIFDTGKRSHHLLHVKLAGDTN